MTNAAPTESLPERCRIVLFPENLNPEIMAAVPEELRGQFYFYGTVTPDQYRQLSKDPEGRSLKARLGLLTTGPDSWTICVTWEDVVTHETGSRAMQSRMIRYFLEQTGQQTPESEEGWTSLAKSLEEMPYAAVEFLLTLADLYHWDSSLVTDQDIAEAMGDQKPSLTLPDFANL